MGLAGRAFELMTYDDTLGPLTLDEVLSHCPESNVVRNLIKCLYQNGPLSDADLCDMLGDEVRSVRSCWPRDISIEFPMLNAGDWNYG